MHLSLAIQPVEFGSWAKWKRMLKEGTLFADVGE
jgi:hypothetical protein